jgi:hypothetical protein
VVQAKLDEHPFADQLAECDVVNAGVEGVQLVALVRRGERVVGCDGLSLIEKNCLNILNF